MGAVSKSLLEKVVKALNRSKIECIIIGNSAGALHGAPLTTMDIDFAIRNTKKNIDKLTNLAHELNGYLTQPFLPASKVWRLITNEIQLDFMLRMDGIKSFESLRSRAKKINIGKTYILVASLEDIIKSKKACNRDKDKTIIPLLEQVLEIKKRILNN